MGLEDCIPALKAKGLVTYRKYAFATQYNPNQSDTSVLTADLLQPIAEGNENAITDLRILWHEAWAVSTKEMEVDVGTADPTHTRNLGQPELNARRDKAEKSNEHIDFEDPEMDVSDDALQMVVNMVEKNKLKYVGWEHAAVMLAIGEFFCPLILAVYQAKSWTGQLVLHVTDNER